MANLQIDLITHTSDIASWHREELRGLFEEDFDSWGGLRVVAVHVDRIEKALNVHNADSTDQRHSSGSSASASHMFTQPSSWKASKRGSYGSYSYHSSDSYGSSDATDADYLEEQPYHTATDTPADTVHETWFQPANPADRTGHPGKPLLPYEEVTAGFLYRQFEELYVALLDYEDDRLRTRLPAIGPLCVALASVNRDYKRLAWQLSRWDVAVLPLPDAILHGKGLKWYLYDHYAPMEQEFARFTEKLSTDGDKLIHDLREEIDVPSAAAPSIVGPAGSATRSRTPGIPRR